MVRKLGLVHLKKNTYQKGYPKQRGWDNNWERLLELAQIEREIFSLFLEHYAQILKANGGHIEQML